MKIKYKLMISYFVLIFFSVSILVFLLAQKVNDTVLKEVNEKSKSLTESISTTLSVRNDLLSEKSNSDLNFVNTLLNNFGDFRIDYNEKMKVGEFDLPVLYIGKQKLTLDDTIPDQLKQPTGTVATIFLLYDNKLIRVSSTIFKEDKSIIGTYISSDSESYKKILNNEEYSGNIVINGDGYVTKMEPLLDKDKKVIGAIGIGNKILNEYLEDTLNNVKFGNTGYAYILDSTGKVIIHPADVGKNVRDYDFVDNIFSNKSGIVEYTYNGIKKVAYYKYFKDWQWYIVVTANYDELISSSRLILQTAIFAGLIIIILGGIIAVILSNNLVKPINKLKKCMEIAEKGDLTVQCEIKSKDEIGVLSDSFNKMLIENKRLLEETLQYDKLKTEFIANMSHELRTPLNIIFSTVQLFNLLVKNEQMVGDEKILNYIEVIKQNCYRLIRLVNNLIDMTKIDSGFMKIEMKNNNIVEVAENIVQSTIEYANYMSRTIIFDTDTEEKNMAFDAEKLERILLNLISNAIKFTEPGDTINIDLFNKEDKVIISVKDTGRGIKEEKISQLFKRFKQVHPLLSRSHEGSGIGLNIVKALVELHGGTIEVKSKYNEGTEFIISLPANVIDQEPKDEINIKYSEQENIENINIEFSDIYK